MSRLNRRRHPLRLAIWVAAGLAVATLTAGCPDEEKSSPPIFPVPGPEEFGSARALDLPPSSPAGSVSFDPARHAAMGPDGDGMAIYLADDGTGTVRMNVVRYDHTQNPMVRYFTEPETFDANAGDVSDAKVLMGKGGEGLILWIETFNGLPRLFASVQPSGGGGLTPPQLIDEGGDNTTPEGVSGFDAALDSAGNAVIGFYENPASPGQSETFGVFYDRLARTFSAPDKADPFTTSGHPVTALKVMSGPPGIGYLLMLQDADPGAGTVIQCSVSRFSSESSLSAFNAATRVNPPGYNDDVLDFTGAVLPNGDGLILYEQPHPTTGASRVWSRVFDFSGQTFTEALPQDLAPQGSAAADHFTGPVTATASDGTTVALFRTTGSGASLHANVFDPDAGTFDTTGSTKVSVADGPVRSGYRFAFGPHGIGEAVFVQALSVSGGPERLFASRFTGATGTFEAPRPADLGGVETGELQALPMVFSDPRLVGTGFDARGRFLVCFTGSDGLLTRVFVNRAVAGRSDAFEGARAVDAANRSSLFAPSSSRSQVQDGQAALLLASDTGEGMAVWRRQEVVGTETTYRLFGNSYHGYNLPPAKGLTGAVLVDEHPEAASARRIHQFDGAATATGAVTALVQDAGATRELYVRAYDAHAQQFDLPGLDTVDNGTSADVLWVDVVPGSGDDAFVFFLQDDGSGTVHLYGARYEAASRSVLSLRSGSHLSSASSGFGSVTDVSVDAAGGRAFVAYRQEKGSGHGAFVLRVDADGTVTGPARVSAASASTAGAPSLWASDRGRTLVLFKEGQDLMGQVILNMTFGQALSDPPVSLESAGDPIGAFDADADGQGNFLAVWEEGAVGSGSTVMFRRYLHGAGAWDAGAVSVSAAGTTGLDHHAPRVGAADDGRAVILFTRTQTGTTDDVSLLAAAFDPGAGHTLKAAEWVDHDEEISSGLDVGQASLAMDPASGRGFVVFLQDVEIGAPRRDRLFLRGFDLDRTRSGDSVFNPTPGDMSAGGASAQTHVPFFDVAVGPDGKGFLMHGEQIPNGWVDTVTHLFARPFDLAASTFAPTGIASRQMKPGAGTVSGEGVDDGKVLINGEGDAFLLHTVAQTDSSIPRTYRRLFGNVYR